MKKIITSVLIVCFLLGSIVTVYACGGHHSKKVSATWHKDTEYYDGHYSNTCANYDHVWHTATTSYEAHYSYACVDHGHNYTHTSCNSGYHH